MDKGTKESRKIMTLTQDEYERTCRPICSCQRETERFNASGACVRQGNISRKVEFYNVKDLRKRAADAGQK